jgi:hypothetical protein
MQNGKWERSGDLIRMVSRDSAVWFQTERSNQLGIRADHSKIVKFRSVADENYDRIVRKLQDILEKQQTGDSRISSSISQRSHRDRKRLTTVPFRKHRDYIGNSQIRDFVARKGPGQDRRMEYMKVALCGLPGSGYDSFFKYRNTFAYTKA